jgi:hypothetical protein
MKIPKTLKIGAHTFKVILEKPDKLAPEDFTSGLIDDCLNEIVLDASRSRSKVEQALFHEILHALNSELDHALLDSLAEQLYQVFHDNSLLK